MSSSNQDRKVRFGNFEANLATEELWKNGVRLRLGGQPFGILRILLERPGELVSREHLRTELWSSDTFVDFNHGLNAAMNKLRQCLNDTADNPRFIETLPRRGYRFVAPVESVDGFHPAAPDSESLSPAVAPLLENSPPHISPASPAAVPVSPGLPETGWKRLTWVTPLLLVGVLGCAMLIVATSLTLLRGRRESGRIPYRVDRGEVLGGGTYAASDPAFSPDGTQIAYRRLESGTGAAGICVADPHGERERRLTVFADDCCPVWSPDGKKLAFVRTEGGGVTVYSQSASGGGPDKLYAFHSRHSHPEVAWSPDGSAIVISADSLAGGAELAAISLSTHARTSLSEPGGAEVDWGPSFSPDGTQLAFVREAMSGSPEEILIIPATGGRPRQITSGNSRVLGPPAWTADGKWIIFGSTQGEETRLMRVSSNGGPAEPVDGIGSPSWHPALPRMGKRLAYQRVLESSGIWQMLDPLSDGHSQRRVITSSYGRNEGPQPSPDGKHLAFMSDRSGSMEIWVSAMDGSSSRRLTEFHGCGTPRWSPDSKFIVFDTVRDGDTSIYLVDADGGPPRKVVGGPGAKSVPSWSRDSKWIYFAARESGEHQVWRIPVEGGAPQQITRSGGFAGFESPDGKYFYYAKSWSPRPPIWRVPVEGGLEEPLSPLLHPGSWANWAVTERGIFLIDDQDEAGGSLEFYDLATKQIRLIESGHVRSFWLAASPDGKDLWFAKSEQQAIYIAVQENFE